MWGIYGVHKRMWLSEAEGWVSDPDKARGFTLTEKQNVTLPVCGIWARLPMPTKTSAGFKLQPLNGLTCKHM